MNTNNYWSTNFQADQGGQIRFRFWLLPSAKQALGLAAQAAIARSQPLAAHLFAELGPVKNSAGSLLATKLGPLLLTRLEPDGSGIALSLLNPSDEAVEARIGSGALKLKRANRTSMSGEVIEALNCTGDVHVSVAPRAWTRIAVYPD